MELNAKKLNLICRSVKYILADLRTMQLAKLKQIELSPTNNDIDLEYVASISQEIDDYTKLHQELEICRQYNKYPLND